VLIDRRQANDFRLRIFGGAGERPIAFICECDDAACSRTVVLARAAYEDLRTQRKPILCAGHVPGDDAPLAAELGDRSELPTVPVEGGLQSPEIDSGPFPA